ncbi:hypothetical protein ACFYZB_01165 [Streptomyces sp. NPDC001852]|uniref:hypothetical protein n=1 Tax=unclassified Streptomyces TaxID=2593676 RepID=UPI00331907DD
MKVYMVGTSDGRSTASGEKEIWMFDRAREVSAGRFVRAGVVLGSDMLNSPDVFRTGLSDPVGALVV